VTERKKGRSEKKMDGHHDGDTRGRKGRGATKAGSG